MESNAKKILKVGSLIVLFSFIFIYAFFRSKDLIFGVKIKNVNLVNGARYAEDVIKITGVAKNATYLGLNDREISIDQAGNFSEDFALLSGYNILKIEAKDKFGHIDEKNYQLIH